MRRLAGRFIGALKSAIGPREASLILGIALVGYGAGLVFWPAAFVLPGMVLLYVSIVGLR